MWTLLILATSWAPHWLIDWARRLIDLSGDYIAMAVEGVPFP